MTTTTDNRTDEQRREHFLAERIRKHTESLNERFGRKTRAQRIDDAGQYIELTAVPNSYKDGFEFHNIEFGRSVTHRGTTFLSKLHKMGITKDDARGVQGYAYGLGSMLTAQRRARAPQMEVATGDVIQTVIDGEYVDFLLEWVGNEWLKLHRINPDGSLQVRVERNGEPS